MINLAAEILGQVIGLFGDKGKATQESLKARVENMQRSWTDEFITAFWFLPMLVGWFNPEAAATWIRMVFSTSPEYSGLLIGITVAVFGLGKINGRTH